MLHLFQRYYLRVIQVISTITKKKNFGAMQRKNTPKNLLNFKIIFLLKLLINLLLIINNYINNNNIISNNVTSDNVKTALRR